MLKRFLVNRLGEDNGFCAVDNQAATSILYVKNMATLKTQRALI
jgi:hypothetical protein